HGPHPHHREGRDPAEGVDQPALRARGDALQGAARGREGGPDAEGLRRRDVLGQPAQARPERNPLRRGRRGRAHRDLDGMNAHRRGAMKGITGASTIVMLAVGVAALAGALGPADDDLAVVKKAVASPAAKSAPASPATTEASALPLLAAQATAAQATP